MLAKHLLSFKLKDNKISSLGSVSQGRLAELTIKELASKLPDKAICSRKPEDWLQYLYEKGYGLCLPK